MPIGIDFKPVGDALEGSPPSTLTPAAVTVAGLHYQAVNDWPTYDSGPVLLTTSTVQVLSRTIKGLVLRLVRIDASVSDVVTVTVTDGNDVPIIPPAFQLGPQAWLDVPLYRLSLTSGVKWSCSALNAVRAQVNGYETVES